MPNTCTLVALFALVGSLVTVSVGAAQEDSNTVAQVEKELLEVQELSAVDLGGRKKANENFDLLSDAIRLLAAEIDILKSALPREIYFETCEVAVTSTSTNMNYHRGDGVMAGQKCPKSGWVVVGVGDAKHKRELRMQNLYCCKLGLQPTQEPSN